MLKLPLVLSILTVAPIGKTNLEIRGSKWFFSTQLKVIRRAAAVEAVGKAKLATPSIFAQITLLIPIGESHMIALIIFMITSSIILKNLATTCAFLPR